MKPLIYLITLLLLYSIPSLSQSNREVVSISENKILNEFFRTKSVKKKLNKYFGSIKAVNVLKTENKSLNGGFWFDGKELAVSVASNKWFKETRYPNVVFFLNSDSKNIWYLIGFATDGVIHAFSEYPIINYSNVTLYFRIDIGHNTIKRITFKYLIEG
ncbi:MAG: hypothetical protein KDC79_02770 [Cyclobacteriaceae bacterium]|nr:hypothetical protein [Cyclobacteriaceae bacterium]